LKKIGGLAFIPPLVACGQIEMGFTLLSSVLCGCETWSVTLREEHRLRVFENRVLRRICGPRSGVTIGWREIAQWGVS
jgi:hypothetical protein